MVTNCAIYREGRCVKDGLSLDDLREVESSDGWVWIDVDYEGGSDATALGEAIDLPDFSLTELQQDHPRSRINDLDGDYFIVVRTAGYSKERESIDFGEIQVLLGADYAITVRHDATGDSDAIKTLLDEKRDLVQTGPAAVAWAVIENVVAAYEPIIEALDLDIDEVEEVIFKREGTDITRRMYALRSTIADFYRAVHPLQGPLEAIESGVFENLDDSHSYFKELRDRLRLLEEELTAQRDQLSSAFDANMALISKEQNEIVQTISSWAAIIAVPTLLSGIYGMNFKKMPGVDSSYGLPIALLIFLLVGAALYALFKRSKWL